MNYDHLTDLVNEMHEQNQKQLGHKPSTSRTYAPLNPTEYSRPHVVETLTLIQLTNNSKELRAQAAAVLWRAIHQETDEFLAFSHYLSFLSVMLPEVGAQIETTTRHIGYSLEFNVYPGTYAYAEYDDEDTKPFTIKMSVVCLGLALLVPYKAISQYNFRGYFEKRVNALASLVVGEGLEIGIPFSAERCRYIKNKMIQFNNVRRFIVEFLIDQKTHAETLLQNVIRYVLVMLAWNEMSDFFFVMEALVASSSPVFLCLELANETKRYFHIASIVFGTEHPSLYKHLAPLDSLVLLDKAQYPTLFAVSYEILSEKHKSIRQLVGPSNMNDSEIERYKLLHFTFVRKNLMVTTPVERWMPDLLDPGIKHATTQMRHFGLQRQDYIDLKAHSSQRPVGGATSAVRDSHHAEN